MIELQGKYNTAKVFTDNIDETTIGQVIELLNQEFVKGSNVRIMPDCHAGAGCVIGTTMTLTDKVVPNLVGVDIGCGMRVVKLQNKNIDLAELDRVIHENIPAGFSVRSTAHAYSKLMNLTDLTATISDMNRARLSIGTLGGGNHFIEVDKDDEGYLYLVIHSGSRNLGKQTAEYWQNIAIATCPSAKTKALAYLEGQDFTSYINDMSVAQWFADLNRLAMANVIIEEMNFTPLDSFTTIHNYINTETLVLRKGAVSALAGERLIIPINMRDGSIIAVGKGNADWNESAPHGAGRLMGRGQAKRSLSLDEFTTTMEGIYTTTANITTLDEAPMAYKNMDEIIANTADTITIEKIIRPIYNFKSAGD